MDRPPFPQQPATHTEFTIHDRIPPLTFPSDQHAHFRRPQASHRLSPLAVLRAGGEGAGAAAFPAPGLSSFSVPYMSPSSATDVIQPAAASELQQRQLLLPSPRGVQLHRYVQMRGDQGGSLGIPAAEDPLRSSGQFDSVAGSSAMRAAPGMGGANLAKDKLSPGLGGSRVEAGFTRRECRGTGRLGAMGAEAVRLG